MSTKIIPKKSSVAGRIPASADLSIGELALNLTDRTLYSKDSSGTVFSLNSGGSPAATARFWSFAISGNYLYLGSILTSDFPSSGSIYDSPMWDIQRITSNAAGDVVSESSATGAWSNKQNLQFS